MDAALVRVMKARKKMNYNDLRLEIVTLMRTFKPDDALIKKRIDSLIERDYLEKDKDDENQIIYKAWSFKTSNYNAKNFTNNHHNNIIF